MSMQKKADFLVDRVETSTITYKLEISPDKATVTTQNPNDFQKEIT